MQNNFLTGLVVLLVALGVGYWVGAGSTPAPLHTMPDGTTMHNAMADMNAALIGKTGDALDKAFIDEMIVHHEGAVDMAKLLLAGTARPELIKLGNDIISAQTGEIEMMKRWRAEWFQ